jgi:RimK family alpha-L-glutamate ligase
MPEGYGLKMGIITRNENGWCSTQLREAMGKRDITPVCFNYHQLVARVKYKPDASVGETNVLQDLSALITRPIGRGSLEEIIFRMDLLHRLERLGMLIINPPLSIERSVDKYYALSLLEEHGLPVPRTAVTESHEEALKCFRELGGDVILKPLFGSRGVGSTRISDPDVAERVFRTISFYHGVLYLQEFIPHGVSDIRAFVVGDRVVASMHRIAETWKTNVSLGAKPVSINLDEELENLAVKAAEVIGCKVTGVDILEGPKGPVVVELNSQPGWRGLQSVTKRNIADQIIGYILSELKA